MPERLPVCWTVCTAVGSVNFLVQILHVQAMGRRVVAPSAANAWSADRCLKKPHQHAVVGLFISVLGRLCPAALPCWPTANAILYMLCAGRRESEILMMVNMLWLMACSACYVQE